MTWSDVARRVTTTTTTTTPVWTRPAIYYQSNKFHSSPESACPAFRIAAASTRQRASLPPAPISINTKLYTQIKPPSCAPYGGPYPEPHLFFFPKKTPVIPLTYAMAGKREPPSKCINGVLSIVIHRHQSVSPPPPSSPSPTSPYHPPPSPSAPAADKAATPAPPASSRPTRAHGAHRPPRPPPPPAAAACSPPLRRREKRSLCPGSGAAVSGPPSRRRRRSGGWSGIRRWWPGVLAARRAGVWRRAVACRLR